MVRQGAVIPAWGQAVSATRSPACGAAWAEKEISAQTTAHQATARAENRPPRTPLLLVRSGRSPAAPGASERNLVIEIAALAAGAGHCPLPPPPLPADPELPPADSPPPPT